MSDSECEHPVECHFTDRYGETFCRWCEDVDDLRLQLKAIRNQIHKKALVVEDGATVNLNAYELGYLEQRGGIINFMHDGELKPGPRTISFHNNTTARQIK